MAAVAGSNFLYKALQHISHHSCVLRRIQSARQWHRNVLERCWLHTGLVPPCANGEQRQSFWPTESPFLVEVQEYRSRRSAVERLFQGLTTPTIPVSPENRSHGHFWARTGRI